MFAGSRLRIAEWSLILVTAASLVACHKQAPQKPKPVEVKKSPAEIIQLAESEKKSLEELRPQLSALNAKFVTLHGQFDALPADLPDFGEVRGKFYGADEGLGRMNAKIPWLIGRIDSAVKSGDGAELDDISKSIARSFDEIPEVNQIAMELFHQAMQFTRLAEELRASTKASCEPDKAGATSATGAASALKKKAAH